MKACFVFDHAAWEIPAARFTVATLASLLEMPWRMTPAGSPLAADEALVFVGAPDRSPAEAAAVLAVEGWPDWDARSLEVGEFEGVPLPCAPGALAASADPRVVPAAALRSVGFVLAREEEAQDPRRDQWECYSGLFSRQHELGILDRPIVNALARVLERRLESHAERRHATIEKLPRWKGGARFAVVLTHDVDDVTLYSAAMAWRLFHQSAGPSSYAFRAGLAGFVRALRHARDAGDPYWNLDRWMAEEERRGFRSSYFFCAPDPARRHEYDPLYRMSDQVGFEGRRQPLESVLRAMRARGHEVGLHGTYHSYLDGRELERQRLQIAEAAGGDVTGLRQHFLRFDARTTWAAQAAAGFGHDCTLGYNEAIGFRAGIAAPFRPWDGRGRRTFDLLEVPLSCMDGILFRTLKLDGQSAAARVREHLDRVEISGGLAVLLWHPNAADERHFPGWWECYLRTLDHLADRGAWVTTAAGVAEWWRERAARQDRLKCP